MRKNKCTFFEKSLTAGCAPSAPAASALKLYYYLIRAVMPASDCINFALGIPVIIVTGVTAGNLECTSIDRKWSAPRKKQILD